MINIIVSYSANIYASHFHHSTRFHLLGGLFGPAKLNTVTMELGDNSVWSNKPANPHVRDAGNR